MKKQNFFCTHVTENAIYTHLEHLKTEDIASRGDFVLICVLPTRFGNEQTQIKTVYQNFPPTSGMTS